MGFLTDLLGTGADDPKTQAMGLLAAGLMSGSPAQGFLAANQHFAEAPDRKLKRDMGLLQMDNLRSEIDARKLASEQAKQRADMFKGLLAQLDSAAPQANQSVIAQTGNLAPTMANAQIHNQALSQATQGNPLANIPRAALNWEMATGDGKKIGDWILDASKPDMQNINGVWVDKKKAQPGQSIPQMSPTGQGYQIIPDPTAPNGYRIVEPAGSSDLYRKFKGIDADIASSNELVTVDLPGGPRQMTKAQALRMVGGGTTEDPQLPQVGGGQALTPQLREAIARDAQANGITNPQTAFAGAKPGQMYGFQPAGAPAAPTALSVASAGLGVPLKAKPTKGQETVDAEFGKDYASFVAGGGFADIQKQLDQLQVAADGLKAEGSALTGPLVGMQPDWMLNVTNPQAANAKELVTESVQRNLRLVLGAQFTEKEGERLIARAYNPMLKPEENARRVERLITQIRSAAESKADAARYFEENGTLAGWKGRLPTFADFSPEGREASGKVGQETAPKPLPANASANNLQKGALYTLPNGKTAEWDGFRFKVK